MFECLSIKDNKVIIHLKAVPNSSKNQISLFGDYIKINITAPPLDNRANEAIIKFIAKSFNIKKSQVQFESGDKSKLKKISISDTSIEYIENKINEVIHG